MAISAKERKRLPKSAFVYPSRRAYPINTKKRAISALGRAKNPRTKGNYNTVRAAVLKRYPSLRKNKRRRRGRR